MHQPLRPVPRVLLTSVFRPFAQDDEFGSRAINPIDWPEGSMSLKS